MNKIAKIGAMVAVFAAAWLGAFQPLRAGDLGSEPAGGVEGASDRETLADLKRQIAELNQKVKILERKEELNAEERDKTKKEAPLVVADSKGLSVSSADKKNVFRLRGLIQADSRWYFGDGGINNNDSFVLRRARPIFEGKLWDNYEFKFVPDFGGTAVAIQDAFINVNYWKEFQVKAGKFKTPVGLELLQEDAYTFFQERALPTNLVPNRDIGVVFNGELFNGILAYQAGVLNGLGDGRNSGNVDIDDERDYVARIFLQPWRNDPGYFQGLGFGVGGSFGGRSLGANGLTAGYLTDGQQTFFAYNAPAAATDASPNVLADGDTWRIAPQAYWYYGPFGLLGEYTVSSTGARLFGAGTNNRFDRFNNTAWQIAGSWVLTGEDASYQSVKPKENLDFKEGTWGAFELVARYGQLNVDGDAFRGAAGSTGAIIAQAATTGSAQDAEAWGVGMNWYLNSNVRVTLDYFQTSFYGGNGSNLVVKEGESALLTRLQLYF